MHSSQVVVVSRSPEDVETVTRALEKEVSVHGRVLANGSHNPMLGVETPPDVLVLLLTEYSHLELQELIAIKTDERPPLIIVGSATDPNVMRLAMQAGARDFLPELDPAELLASVFKIIREGDELQSSQRLISFVSGKGGSGGTFLAANYAHLLCENHKYATLLMDLDRQFVDLPQYLGINPEASLLDALRIVDELDEMAISAFISKHRSGLSVASHKVVDVIGGTEDVPFDEPYGINQFVGIAKRKFTHIVAEVPRYLDALGARYLELSDQIIVVMQQNVPSVRDTLRMLRLLTVELDIPKDRITVLVNRYGDSPAMSLADVRQSLGGYEVATIANDFVAASSSIDMGVPVKTENPKSPIVKDLSDLIYKLEGLEPATERGILSRSLSAMFRN